MDDKDFILSEQYGSSDRQIFYTVNNKKDLVATANERQKNKKHVSLDFFRHLFISIFLPQGYPDSVSKDYLEYQIWDTLQAFCSSITGILATHAMLKGYGVGDESATAAAATITWMLKDGAGMLGRILFAWKKSIQLDCDAKRWRFYADIINDIAIFLDLMAPMFKNQFLLLVCFSSVLRSIVGVAGGATRAALTLHQARRDNMADVSAKDGSQETLVNLMALIAGFVITPLVSNNFVLTWSLFFIFTFLHLYSNYRAVSAVVMETVNLPRLNILLRKFIETNSILSPDQVSKVDPVLSGAGYKSKIIAGCSLEQFNLSFEDLHDYEKTKYIIMFNELKGRIYIALRNNVSVRDRLKSCYHALLLDLRLANDCAINTDFLQEHTDAISVDQDISEKKFSIFESRLKANGWDLDRLHLPIDEWRFSR